MHADQKLKTKLQVRPGEMDINQYIHNSRYLDYMLFVAIVATIQAPKPSSAITGIATWGSGIYQFSCLKCRVIFDFLSKTVAPKRSPSCPKCKSQNMVKQVTRFATLKGLKEPAKPGGSPGDPRDEKSSGLGGDYSHDSGLYPY